jgi:hypothetical protein
MQDRGTSFVIRLWLERSSDVQPEWRWQTLHVQSGRERHGRRLVDLLAFVEQESGLPPPELCTRPDSSPSDGPPG